MEEEYEKLNKIFSNCLKFLCILHEFNQKYSEDYRIKIPESGKDKTYKYSEIKGVNGLIKDTEEFIEYMNTLEFEIPIVELDKLKRILEIFLQNLKSQKKEPIPLIKMYFSLEFTLLSNNIYSFHQTLLLNYGIRIKHLNEHNDLLFQDLYELAKEIIEDENLIKKNKKKYSENSYTFFLSFEATFKNALTLYDNLINLTYSNNPKRNEELISYSSSILFLLVSSYEKILCSIAYQLDCKKSIKNISYMGALDYIQKNNENLYNQIKTTDRFEAIKTARNLRNAETHRLAEIKFSEISGSNISLIIEIKNLLKILIKAKKKTSLKSKLKLKK